MPQCCNADRTTKHIPCLHQSKNRFHFGHHRFKFCVGVNRSRSSSNSKKEFKKANLKMTFRIIYKWIWIWISRHWFAFFCNVNESRNRFQVYHVRVASSPLWKAVDCKHRLILLCFFCVNDKWQFELHYRWMNKLYLFCCFFSIKSLANCADDAHDVRVIGLLPNSACLSYSQCVKWWIGTDLRTKIPGLKMLKWG